MKEPAHIAFAFKPLPPRGSEGLREFGLGHLEVNGNLASVTSEGRHPDQAMMVFLACSDLLTTTCEILVGGRKKSEFVGPDSSFCVVFECRSGEVVVKQGKKTIANVPKDVLARSVLKSVEQLLQSSPLRENSAVLPDIVAQKAELEHWLARL